MKLFRFDRNSTGSMILFLGSSQMISNALRILGGLLMAKLLLPQIMGTFNGFGLVLGYLPVMQIGVMNGLNRQLPYFFGAGEVDKAKRIAAVSQYYEIILGIGSFSVLSIVSIFYLFKGDFVTSAGFFTYAIASFHHYYSINYLQILYRTNRDFNKLSINSLIGSIVSLVLIVFVWLWSFYGLCIRTILLALLDFALLWKFRPLKVKPIWDYPIFKEIIKVGFPIFLVGYVFLFWGTIQDTMIFKLGGNLQFGYYALAAMVMGSLSIITGSVSQVIYPKMAYAYGQGANVNELLRSAVKPVLVVFAILLPSIIIIWYALPPIVHFLLPQYEGGVSVAQWSLLLIFVNIFGVFNIVFNVIQKQRDYLISIVCGIIVFVLVAYSLYHFKGFYLILFPQAMIVGKLTQIIIASFYINNYRLTLKLS